ncbi:MAG: hypothetical protein ABJC39_11335, partial [Chloroflexota bacterium]
QLLVGPKAPSGKKTIVRASLTRRSSPTSRRIRSVALQDGTKAQEIDLVDLTRRKPGAEDVKGGVVQGRHRRRSAVQRPDNHHHRDHEYRKDDRDDQ